MSQPRILKHLLIMLVFAYPVLFVHPGLALVCAGVSIWAWSVAKNEFHKKMSSSGCCYPLLPIECGYE